MPTLVNLILFLSLSLSLSAQKAQSEEIGILGDSIFSFSGEIKNELERLTPLVYTSYAITGATSRLITWQYERARRKGFKTFIMNAGGNDVLLGAAKSCQSDSKKCRYVIDRALLRVAKIFRSMYLDGVEKVFFLGYYHPRGVFKKLKNTVDYANPKIKSLCKNAKIDCEFIDTTKDFMQQKGLISVDGIHPSKKGSRVLARMVLTRLNHHKDRY